MSQRRLDPNTPTTLVSSQRTTCGSKVGLGESVTPGEEQALNPVWSSGAGAGVDESIKLPVYFHWEFSTGLAGDFESLARRLVAEAASEYSRVASNGREQPWVGHAQASTRVLPARCWILEVHCERLKPTHGHGRTKRGRSFQQALREILNTPAAQEPASNEPAMLGPPLYGQWYAKQQTVPVAEGLPHWFRELNLDPRYRVAAGLGTSVVRYEQEQLMASAWDQLAKHEQDNQRLKRAQLAETVGEALVDKHLKRLGPERFLQVTGPVHRAIARGFATADVSAQFLPVPRDHPALSSAFRRLTRPTGPVARRMNRMNPIGQGAAARDVLKGMGTVAALAPQASTPNAVRFEMQAMKTMMLAQLDPKVTVLEAVRREAPSAVSTDLIRFAPEFSQPMYEPLRDYFQGMLLPGLDQVPPNSIALLETNQKFIEAYMVGLNHEMSRELLWRGYPTDRQRNATSGSSGMSVAVPCRQHRRNTTNSRTSLRLRRGLMTVMSGNTQAVEALKATWCY